MKQKSKNAGIGLIIGCVLTVAAVGGACGYWLNSNIKQTQAEKAESRVETENDTADVDAQRENGINLIKKERINDGIYTTSESQENGELERLMEEISSMCD